MKLFKLSFYRVYYKNSKPKIYSNLVMPLVLMNPDVRYVYSESGELIYDWRMKKPTN